MDLNEQKTGIMVCGHGSRNVNAAREFAVVAERLRERFPDLPIEHGYLEFCNPVISAGLDRLREGGVSRVLAVPGMLFAAGHAKNDIPSVLNTYQAAHPGMRIDYGRDLGIDPRMIRAAGTRIGEAVAEANARHGAVPHAETLLVVVGRGASDPDANSNVAKVTRMLWEGMGFGWAETAYSGVTFPLVAPALAHAARLGYRRIVVFPYFLFTGVLVKRIYAETDRIAAEHPGIEFVKAGYLSDHPLVIDTFEARVREIVEGETAMNCQLCKYRAQVLGFEAEVGLAQESHHHHVEGIGGGLENCPCGGDCDASCRSEDFCRRHGLPFTPLHSHGEPGPLEPAFDYGRSVSLGGRYGAFAEEEPVGSTADSILKGQHGAGHSHAHDTHGHHHDHGHHHHPYPHADHPLGPRSMKMR